MANEENLIPWNKRTESEQREYARQGGIKSGEVRRQRKAMKEQMELLLSLPFNLKDSKGNAVADTLEIFGIDKDQIDNQMAMNIALWQTAINSNNRQQVQAIKEIREIVKDEQSSSDDDKVQIINDLPKDGEYDEES